MKKKSESVSYVGAPTEHEPKTLEIFQAEVGSLEKIWTTKYTILELQTLKEFPTPNNKYERGTQGEIASSEHNGGHKTWKNSVFCARQIHWMTC